MKAVFSVSSAIENLERQKIRKEIARVRKLTDQKDLKKIIESEANDSVRRVAVENLTEAENFINQKFLGDTAIWDRSSSVRKAAAIKVTDQGVLEKVIEHSADSSVCEIVVKKITDKYVLEGIAKGDRKFSIRVIALGKLEDQGVIGRIARNDRDPSMRRAAVEMIEDQRLLGTIAINDDVYSVCKFAVGRVTDPDVLEDIAKSDADSSIRVLAIRKIKDTQVLKDIIKDKYKYKGIFVREAAEGRLDGLGQVGISAVSMLRVWR